MEIIELNLKLSIEEINRVIASLSKQPFEEVVNLIAKIKSQGEIQIQELQPTQLGE